MPFSFDDIQLQRVTDIVRRLPPQNRDDCLQRLAASARLIGGKISDHDLDDLLRAALQGLVQEVGV